MTNPFEGKIPMESLPYFSLLESLVTELIPLDNKFIIAYPSFL